MHNTVDNPIFPTPGRRFTASIELAGLGGNTNFYKPRLEGVYFWKQNPRMSLGMRGQVEYIHQFTGSVPLPIFEKLFLGGEYSVRGFDIRSIGPSDPFTGLVLGGNKSLLFNIEQGFTIAGPVRAILFYDAGQVRNTGERFSFWEDTGSRWSRPASSWSTRTSPHARRSRTRRAPQFTTIGQHSAFKTSTGVEIRFFMPVLNVPFRLIFAQIRSAGASATTTCSRSRRMDSVLPSDRPSSRGTACIDCPPVSPRPASLSCSWSPSRRAPATTTRSSRRTLSRACRSRTASRARCRRTGPSRMRSRSPAWGRSRPRIVGLAPNTSQIVGLQLGVWNGTSCTASSSTDVATTGSSITLTASSAGIVCVRLYDVGFIGEPVLYQLQVVHP